MTDWRLKIFAHLHDPPDKPLALGRQGGHEAWGRELVCRLTEKPSDEGWGRWETLIKRADHLASGADRSGLLQRRPPSLDELRHPLSGQPIDISWARPNPEAAVRALEEEFAALEPHGSSGGGEGCEGCGESGATPCCGRTRRAAGHRVHAEWRDALWRLLRDRRAAGWSCEADPPRISETRGWPRVQSLRRASGCAAGSLRGAKSPLGPYEERHSITRHGLSG